MTKIFFICIFQITLLSCGHGKKSVQKTETNQVQSENYRFSVSFYSIGTGINYKAKEEFLALVAAFEKRKKVNLPYETVQWGREGETNLCFNLADLNEEQQKTFIVESKDKLKNAVNVRCSENTPCK